MTVGEANGNVDNVSADGPSSDDESIVALSCSFAASILDRSPHAQADCPARKRRVGQGVSNPCEHCYCFHCDVPVSECSQQESHAPCERSFSICKDDVVERDQAVDLFHDKGKKNGARPEVELEFVELREDVHRLVRIDLARFDGKAEHGMPLDDVLKEPKAPANVHVKLEGKETRSVSDRLTAIEYNVAAILRRLSALETNLQSQGSKGAS
jgi:hypothetical protein